MLLIVNLLSKFTITSHFQGTLRNPNRTLTSCGCVLYNFWTLLTVRLSSYYPQGLKIPSRRQSVIRRFKIGVRVNGEDLYQICAKGK